MESARPCKEIRVETGGEAQLLKSQFTCQPKTNALSSTEDQTDDVQIFDLDISPDEREIEDVNILIGKELAALSMEDREQVYYDLHGVSGEVQETEKLIEDSLKDFQIALDDIQEKKGYEEAMRIDKSFVEDSDFRLRFLRADRFDVSEAAARYVRHFDVKLDLFGMDMLCRHIEQDDLDPDDLESLYDGSMFPLPSRDSIGRHLSCATYNYIVNIKAILRKLFYAGMVRSEDETNLKKGMVVVGLAVGQEFSWHGMIQRRRLHQDMARVTNAIPTRLEALHFCYDAIHFRVVVTLFAMAAALFSRLRIKEHLGSLQEILFSLQTYGIPTHHFPIAADGTIIKELTNESWVKRRKLERKRREEENKMCQQNETMAGDENAWGPKTAFTARRVGIPDHNDVLMGRGKSSYTYVGNIRFRNLILEHYPMYERTAINHRKAISQTILDEIKGRSGRFLKDDGMGWVEVDDKIALRKVAHAFRSVRALQSDVTNNESSTPWEADKRIKRERSEEF